MKNKKEAAIRSTGGVAAPDPSSTALVAADLARPYAEMTLSSEAPSLAARVPTRGIRSERRAPWGTGQRTGVCRSFDSTEEDWEGLLQRAAEIGLLTDLRNGFFSVHPAVSWFLANMFKEHHGSVAAAGAGDVASDESTGAVMALRAFAEVTGGLGNFLHDEYGTGDPALIGALRFEK